MRFAPIALPFALLLASGAASAQTATSPEAAPPATTAPSITIPETLPGTGTGTPAPGRRAPRGITREDFIRRATENAGRRFDSMDTNHDGILEPAEIRAWRDAHGLGPAPQITVHSAPASQ